MAKTNVPKGRTRQSRRLNPDAVEKEENNATPEDEAKTVEEDKPGTKEEKIESDSADQPETVNVAENQAESASPDEKTEEDKAETQDSKGESDSTGDKTEEEKTVPANTEDQTEVTSSDAPVEAEAPQEGEEMKDEGDAEPEADIEVKGTGTTVNVSWESKEQQDQEMPDEEDVTKTDNKDCCVNVSDDADVEAEVEADVEVKGSATTVNVSWETKEQQDQEMPDEEDVMKSNKAEICDEKASAPEVVLDQESEEASTDKGKEEDEMEESEHKDTKQTEDTQDAEMETAASVPTKAEQKPVNDDGESENVNKKAKQKRKAKPPADSSPPKQTKLSNDGYCIYVGNLNNAKFYEDIRNTLAQYFMKQRLLVQDIRLDKAKKHAFVDLASEMDFNKALTLNGQELLDKPLKVYKAKVKQADEEKAKKPKPGKKERSLFVENIPFAATREDVLKVFPKATAVRFFGGTETPSKGIAFVEFQTKEQTNAALKLNGKAKIQGRCLRVNVVKGNNKSDSNNNAKAEARPSDTLFVKSLPDKVKEIHIKRVFQQAVRINIPQSDGKSKRYAFVVFKSVAQAEAALKSAQKSKIMKRPIRVEFSLKSQREDVTAPSKSLMVLGLSDRTTAVTLREVFDGAKASRILMSKGTRHSKRFGFVDFESVESCVTAKEAADDMEIDGSKVTVVFARPKKSEKADSGEKVHSKGKKAHRKGKRQSAGPHKEKRGDKLGVSGF